MYNFGVSEQHTVELGKIVLDPTTTTTTTTTTTKMFIQGNPTPFCKKGSLGALLLGVNTKNKLNKNKYLYLS